MATRKKKRGKGKVAASTASVERHKKVMEAHPAGSGERFKSLEAEIRRKGKVRSPKAVVAAIGRKKYGSAEFQKMAAAGRKRKVKKKA